jgi:DNA polymerase-3 subunit gamma/tau
VSLALARKYRPASFEDLIGQESVSQTLSLALESNRLSHAYLFSGLRGSGKTSTARIFAKALLCEQGASAHPCGGCNSCLMASEGRHIDIIEMDAASNRKIDDIRELIEHTKYKPASGRYKIFIIDEVHMLTKEAFNALLKTLEEPPDFVKFILATTDPLKLPATILSRTQHFRFRNISQSVLTHHLEHILALENVGYEKEAIEIIARSGAGSVRDALTLLDQAIVYSKNFIDLSTVTDMLGIIEPSLLEALIDKILLKDEAGILEFISMAKEFEAEMVIDELMLYLKEMLLGGSHKLNPMIIERFFRVLAEAKQLLSIGSNGEFVLALSLFKMMESLEIQDIDGMIRTLEKELASVNIERSSSLSDGATVAIAPTVEKKVLPSEQRVEEEISDQKEESIPPAKPIDSGAKQFALLIDKLYDRNYELGECFKKVIVYISFEKDILTWESTANDEEKRLLRNHWNLIRMFVQEIFGYETSIKNISKELPPQKRVEPTPLESIEEPISMIEEEVLGHTVEHTNPKSQEEESEKKEEIQEKDKSTILDEPMVAKALELFAPKRVRVKRKS